MFDVKRFNDENASELKKQENKSSDQNQDHPHAHILSNIKAVVDEVIGHSKYNKVDLNSLFSFMDK